MLRRSLRIFCVVGLVVIVGMAVVGQFWNFYFYAGHACIGEGPGGVVLAYSTFSEWRAANERERDVDWTPKLLFLLPKWYTNHDMKSLLLPWWLLLSGWGFPTALIWRLTRRRKVGGAFPVEPAKST